MIIKNKTEFMNSIFPYLGGKARQAKWISSIVDQIPHKTYVEPFCGSAAVFWSKNPSKIEVLNDKEKRFSYFFKALRDHPQKVMNFCSKIEYSKASFDESYEHLRSEDLDDWKLGAWALFQIVASFSGYPDAHSFAWRVKGQNPAIKWMEKLSGLGPYAQRLKEATILNYDGIDLINKIDKDGVLLYVDPPYVGAEKRYKVGKNFSHEKLAGALNNLKNAKVILSHYHMEPYISLYEDWEVNQKKSTQSCRGSTKDSPKGEKKVIEALWIRR